MIKTYAYDIEVLPNAFSITVVDFQNYLEMFNNCKDDKGKPIPLVKSHSVSTIQDMLDNVKRWQFIFTDNDNSQLQPMIDFINNMKPKTENGVAIRTDMYGYNSANYDKMMIAALLIYSKQFDNTKDLCYKLYETSKQIIQSQDDGGIKRSSELYWLYNYGVPYIDIDIMKVFGLNKAGTYTDSKGRMKYFPKSLKQVSINLQWYNLNEYEMPKISTLDYAYYANNSKYKDIPMDLLDNLVEKWDRYIVPEYIDDMLQYNLNDVFIVCEIVRLYIDEIRLRYSISNAYKVDVLNSSRSDMADKLFEKFYSEYTNKKPEEWKGLRTTYTELPFSDVIFDSIHFKTDYFNTILDELKKVVIKDTTKTDFLEKIYFGDMVYTMACGGLHSEDLPRVLRSTKEWKYFHIDANSFYPSIMDYYKLYPAHLDGESFNKLIHWLKESRLRAKHSQQEYIDGVHKDIAAQALKITINSIFGKTGYQYGPLYDLMVFLKVTINGQLLLLMLCEDLELHQIQVVSANTDGIIVKVHKNKINEMENIIKGWESQTGITTDSEEYEIYINRDINNFCVKETNGKIYAKGILNEYNHLADLGKGYNPPIVARAICRYFLYNDDVLNVFRNCTDILDFCKTQNVGKNFHVEYTDNKGSMIMQRNVRYYVSTNGGKLEKVRNANNERTGLSANNLVTVLNKLDNKSITMRNIDYNFYYQEATKVIDQIMLNISAKQKATKSAPSGKVQLKKAGGMYRSLFDDNE